MPPGLKRGVILAGLCCLMTHCVSQKQGSMVSPDKSKAIKNSSPSTASLKEKVKQKSKFSGVVNPKQQDEKRAKKKNKSSFFMDKNTENPVSRSIEKPKSMTGGLLPVRAKIETAFKSKPKDLTQDPQPNISKPEKAFSHPKTKKKVSDQSTYREGNPPPSPNFQNGKTAGDRNVTDLRDYLTDQNYTQRAGLVVGWKDEPLVTEEETNSKPRTLSESLTQPHGNDWNHLKSYLNRNAVLFGDDRIGQMNSLQRAEHWNEGGEGREIKLSDQRGDGPRFQEALRWIQQKGRLQIAR
jgi:hypothetical protein